MNHHNTLQQARQYLEDRLPDYVDLLRQMVGVNSFTANAAGVNALADLTANTFAGLGFTAEQIQSTKAQFGRHLVLTRQGSSRHTIGLVTHLDTVFPAQEEQENNFYWREEGDRLYGPGSVDIKGGTVIIYMILDALRAFAPAVFNAINWVILCDAAEEVDGSDFGELCVARLPAGETLACLVFEGGRVNNGEALVVTSRKGMATYRLMVEGRSSHAGTSHDLGANAVVQMAHNIAQIAGFTDYAQQITFNVGMVSGGTVTNRVPYVATALVEMRAFAPAVYEQGMARMLALPEMPQVASARDGYRCRTTVEVLNTIPPWPCNEGTERLFAIWQAAGEEVGLQLRPEARGGLSDGNYLWQHVPTLDGLGAAGDNAHCSELSADGSKDQEYARRSSLVPKAMLSLAGILKLTTK